MAEINELKTLETPNGEYNSFTDQTARKDLKAKLSAPEGLRPGMILKVKSLQADGAVVLEGVEWSEAGEHPDNPVVDGITIGGENGVRFDSEGKPSAPILALYGAQGDEPVRVSHVAPAQEDGEAVPLGQVKELIRNQDYGQNPGYPTYKDFKAVFLGDSQTAASTAKTKIWWQWVVELLGITKYVNYGKIGATLSNVGKSNTPICTTCEQMDADASMIFVMGGVNEFRGDTQTPFGTITDTSPETIHGAVRYICQKLQAKYPKTPIIFITPTNQTLWTHKDGHSMADLAKAIMDACHMEGVLCLDAQGSLGVNPAYDGSYTSDRLHLNDLGSELLGKWVANQVRQHIPILSSSPNSGDDSGNGDSGETGVTLTGISATYSGGSVPAGTAVTDLTDIVVTAHYSDGSAATVNGYSLNGTIAEGSNTITVSYGGKTTTFTVTGVAESETPVVTLESIGATFDQGNATVKTTDSLDNLKQYLTVTAHYSDGSDKTVTDYTLSGNLTAGTSVVTASYAGKTATFTVVVTEAKTIVLNMGDYSYTSGKYIGMDGAESGSPLFAYTEKIPIPANTEITYNTDVTINPIFYDAERNFISANSKYGGEQGRPGELTVTTPANCAYLVMNMVVNTGASAYYVKYEQ